MFVLPDEYRILVDMRWNKQYLDILANKCNFEDEERYMDFLEALNAVANRWEINSILIAMCMTLTLLKKECCSRISRGFTVLTIRNVT